MDKKLAYVNGFMIVPSECDAILSRVLLIRKNRPAFQAGKWNGIGGKIEYAESPYMAMSREFREETGIETDTTSWERTLILETPEYDVHFFRQFVPVFPHYETVTDEMVSSWPVDALYSGWMHGETFGIPTLDNMKWILPLQLSASSIHFPLTVVLDK